MKIRILLLLLLSVFLLHQPEALYAAGLVGSGCSVSVPGYLTQLSRDYEKITGVKVTVLGGGSVRGLVDLQERRTDFAASCQSKTPDDPEDFEYITASWDALVFIVNKSNPINEITRKQVVDIYEGRINNWKQLGGPDLPLISVISSLKGMGGVSESLAKMFLDGKRPVPQRNSSMQVSSPAIWEQVVEETPGAFAATGFGSARLRNVKMLKINGYEPSKANIISGKYRFRRPLYLIIKRNARPETRKFVDFVLSSQGQKLISSYGMPSLSDIK